MRMHSLLVAALAGAASVACRGGHRDGPSFPQTGFAQIDDGPPSPPSADELLRDARAGTHAGTETELSERMQLRPLRFPKPPRGATARFNLDDGRRGWVTSMLNQEVLNSPAFSKGRVMLGGGFASHEMYALDAYSGELDWSSPAPDGGPSPPIVEDDSLVYNTESCEIFVVDATTGKMRWHKWLGDPLMSQPAAKDGLVFSAYPADGAHVFAAFALKDGSVAWKQKITADVIAAPRIEGDSIYFTTMDGSAHRLARATGRVQWKRDVGAASAPAIDGEHVLVSRKIDAKDGGKDGAQEQPVVLSAKDGSIVREGEKVPAPYFAGKTRDRLLAKSQAGAWGTVPHGEHLGLVNVAAGWAYQGSTATVADGRAYYAVGGDIRAREIASGREVWRRHYAKADGAQAVTPPAVVGGKMFFGTVDGHLYAVDVDLGMTAAAWDVGEPIVYQPIVAQGWVYVTTSKGHVVGLEIGDPSLDGWHMWGGNAEHAGLVATAGAIDPAAIAAMGRPGEGTLRVAEGAKAKEDLPLVDTRVRARVSGSEARVTVEQHFHNPLAKPIEAVYLFPLPDDAAVDDMEMVVGTRTIRAEVKKRAAAQQTYAEAKASGKHAALLEQQRPNLFAQRVANIAPGEKIDVRISYAHRVRFEDGAYEVVYPMTAPNRPASNVDLTVEIDAGLPLATVDSPSHAVTTSRPSPERAVVQLSPKAKVGERDLVVRYATSGDVPAATVLAHRTNDGDGFFSLVVQPPAASANAPIAPRDVSVVIDTSVSMRGRPLEQARTAAKRIVEGLRDGDTVRVLSFSDDVQALAPTPLAAHADTKKRALAFLDGLRPVGSTSMAPAIRAALANRSTDPTRVGIVILATDGFLGNESDVLGEIARGLGSSRLYTLGVGASPNRFLLERAAEIGRGRAIVVAPLEDASATASRLASWTERPVFTDITIDWGGLDVSEIYPRRAPDLFAGKPLVLSGRYGKAGKGTVRLRGTYGGARYERTLAVDLPQASGPLHEAQRPLWARAAVHERLNLLTLADDPKLVDEVTQLGLAHHLVTPWTSLVAVERSANSDADGTSSTAPATQAMLSPARALPGDPEIRIAAPADARAVTVDLPFGETVAAEWDQGLGLWVARFLIPRDAHEGMFSVRVSITRADGTRDVRTTGYTVDEAAPKLAYEVMGEARPGALVTLRATQLASEADKRQAGLGAATKLDRARAHGLLDTRRVEVRLPNGTVVPLAQTGRGVWEARLRVPEGATGSFVLHAYATDVAANVGEETIVVEVRR